MFYYLNCCSCGSYSFAPIKSFANPKVLPATLSRTNFRVKIVCQLNGFKHQNLFANQKVVGESYTSRDISGEGISLHSEGVYISGEGISLDSEDYIMMRMIMMITEQH